MIAISEMGYLYLCLQTLGYSDWPGIVWNAGLCLKKILPDVLRSYKPSEDYLPLCH